MATAPKINCFENARELLVLNNFFKNRLTNGNVPGELSGGIINFAYPYPKDVNPRPDNV